MTKRLLRHQKALREDSNTEQLKACNRDVAYVRPDPDLRTEATQTKVDSELHKVELQWVEEVAERAEMRRPRRIPTRPGNKFPSLFTLPSKRARLLALKWCLGSFPPCSTSEMEELFPRAAPQAFKVLDERLPREKVSDQDAKEIDAALTTILRLFNERVNNVW